MRDLIVGPMNEVHLDLWKDCRCRVRSLTEFPTLEVNTSVVAEAVKRLIPTPDTVRELYLRSGNCCAFPGCERRIISRDGTVLGEMCHIEAAMPGGQRFNPAMSNEERRSAANLMLLCGDHHIITDDVASFTVDRLKQMKADHEAFYSDPVQRIVDAFVDNTTARALYLSSNLRELNAVMGWGHSDEELEYDLEAINELANQVHRVPERPLQVLNVIVDRGSVVDMGLGQESVKAHYGDVREALGIQNGQFWEQLQILQIHRLVNLDHLNEENDFIYAKTFDWNVWSALKQFCTAKQISMSAFLLEGRFHLLDSDKAL